MNYNDVIKEITEQLNHSITTQSIETQTSQQTDDDLMNRIALEIKRQGG